MWKIGTPNVATKLVPVKFRLTMFWNADADEKQTETTKNDADADADAGARPSSSEWVLRGRQKAVRRKSVDNEEDDDGAETTDVPTVAILNAGTYDVIGVPEISCLRESEGLMRWTCMYSADLFQDELGVENFPHDCHALSVKVAIQDHQRAPGERWDRRVWKVALATEDDTLDTSGRDPEGFVVANLRVHDFEYNAGRGLQVGVYPLDIGVPNKPDEAPHELCVVAQLAVARESSYYDKNVVPLLCMITVVAASLLFLDAGHFFERGLMLLNIAFVQIGLRVSVDRYLPAVGYQVKMQEVMNQFLSIVFWLCLESGVLYHLTKYYPEYFSDKNAGLVDMISAVLVILYMVVITCVYYDGMRKKSDILTYEEEEEE